MKISQGKIARITRYTIQTTSVWTVRKSVIYANFVWIVFSLAKFFIKKGQVQEQKLITHSKESLAILEQGNKSVWT